jgi:prefoldin subunit 5
MENFKEMRTKTEIIQDINQTQALCNRLIMDIGQGYAQVQLTKDNTLIEKINQKINAFQKAEVQLRTLEQELANTADDL